MKRFALLLLLALPGAATPTFAGQVDASVYFEPPPIPTHGHFGGYRLYWDDTYAPYEVRTYVIRRYYRPRYYRDYYEHDYDWRPAYYHRDRYRHGSHHPRHRHRHRHHGW